MNVIKKSLLKFIAMIGNNLLISLYILSLLISLPWVIQMFWHGGPPATTIAEAIAGIYFLGSLSILAACGIVVLIMWLSIEFIPETGDRIKNWACRSIRDMEEKKEPKS
jgi:hypothetical protein